MKITLIIPDLHLRWQEADKIIKGAGADEVIFLGDHFDDFGDTPQMIGEMCDWLEAEVKKPNRIFLYGNHDIHYARPDVHFRCSGYEEWKYFLIHDNFEGKKIWDHFQWYHILDDKWLITHAGLHKFNLPKDIAALHKDRSAFLKAIATYLDAEIIPGYRDKSWIFHAGRSRGGLQRVGGIDWCDFEREYYPIMGLNQIVGHTPQIVGTNWCFQNEKDKISYHPTSMWHPKAKDFDNVNRSYTVNLDVHGNTHWAVWDGKTMTFFNYREDL